MNNINEMTSYKLSWTYVFALSILCGALFILIIYLLSSINNPQTEQTDKPNTLAAQPPMASVPTIKAASSKVDELIPAKSLAGTTIDARIEFDAEGNLLLSPALLRIYDYFLAGSVDSNGDDMLAKLRAQINSKLQAPARQQALDLLEKYRAYTSREAELAEAARGSLNWQGNSENIRAVYQQISSLRQQLFGRDAAEKLFVDQPMLAFTLAASELPKKDVLTTINELKALAESLPENDRNAIHQDLKSRELAYYEHQLRKEGASAAQFFIMREQLLGTEAAQNLAKLDQQRAAWQQRIDGFAKDYRQQLEQHQQQNPAENQLPEAQIQKLLDQHQFQPLEARRLRAILQLY